MPEDLAADPASRLGVKPGPEGGNPDAAPASGASDADGDPGVAGNPPSAEGGPKDGRGDKNIAKEALKRSRSAEAQVERLMQQNMQLQEQMGVLITNLPMGNNGAGSEPDGPPHPRSEIIKAMEEGKFEESEDMRASNNAWLVQKTQKDTLTRLRQEGNADKIKSYLAKTGFTDEETTWGMMVTERARELMGELGLPDMETAKALAGNELGRKAAAGELEFEDLRQEHLARSGPRAQIKPTAEEKPKETVDWNAPDRGLSPQLAAEIKKRGHGDYLKKAADPALEAKRRNALGRLLERKGLI